MIEVPTTVMRGNGLCKGRTGFNLIVMVALWIITLVDYGMINIYLKHLPGNRYLNFTTSGVSEIFAHSIVGAFFVQLTPRWTFFIGFAVSLCGAIPLVWQEQFESGALISMFVLLAKFGISMAMCGCYVSTPFIFPILLSGTAFGICNIFGRFFAIASPYIAEFKVPLPMEIFSIMALVGLVICLFLKTTKEEEPARLTLTRTS